MSGLRARPAVALPAARPEESGPDPWWTPRLQDAAARGVDLAGLPPGGGAFLAWLAAARPGGRLDAEPGTEALRRAILDASPASEAAPGPGLAIRDIGDPDAEASPVGRGLVLMRGAAAGDRRWAALGRGGHDLFLLAPPGQEGLGLAARAGAAGGAAGALLEAARDPGTAAAIAALFVLLEDARATAREQRALAEAHQAALRRAAEAEQARRAIEQSTIWRLGRMLAAWLEAHPRLARFVRNAARRAWHGGLRRLVVRGMAVPGAAATAAGRDVALAVPGVGTLVVATLPPGASPPEAVALVTPGGRAQAPLPPAPAGGGRAGRARFAAFFPGLAAQGAGDLLALGATGAEERPAPGCRSLDPRAAIRAALDLVDPQAPEAPALLRDQLGPFVEACWRAACAEPVTVEESVLGAPPAAPEVSIVVPLFGPMDWLLHQAAPFSNDAELLRRAELIYVIDDPERAEEALETARRAHAAYGVPARLLRLSRNCGYAAATNIGARAARAPFLLLMNSDVLPTGPGWLARLLETYRAWPGCGALGCRLLFGDGTIQHAGMVFTPFPRFDAWLCDHPLKNEPAAAEIVATPRAVPAVTGACLLVERSLFEQVGGLCEDYVIGDFEDADLCHRIAAAGRGVVYEPRVALLHLERQSFARIGTAPWRYALTLCNMLRHARVWRARLETLAPLPRAGRR